MTSDKDAWVGSALPGHNARINIFSLSIPFSCRRSQFIRALALCLSKGALSFIEHDIVRLLKSTDSSSSLAVLGIMNAEPNSLVGD